jgi:hypothetical protein
MSSQLVWGFQCQAVSLIQVFTVSIPMFDQRNHPSVPTMMLARRRRGRRSRMAVRPPPQAARSVLEVRPRRRHARRVGRGSAGADRVAGGGRLFQGEALASGRIRGGPRDPTNLYAVRRGPETMMLYAHRMRGSREGGTILSVGLSPMLGHGTPPTSVTPAHRACRSAVLGSPPAGSPGRKCLGQAALSTTPSGSTPSAA